MQRERMLPGEAFVPSLREYAAALLRHAGARAPGPARHAPGADEPRASRSTASVADSAASLIAEQVRSGLVVRMAVLYDVLLGSSVPAPLAASARRCA